MHWNKKRDQAQEERIQEEVPVWECSSEDCKGWMRKNFSFTENPDCPLCGSEMKSGERLLHVLPD
ncbi:cold-shock protein [Ectobacillus ponti]|uniref:Cold-shock protein n=1 Tax=Ectobacillus ponti TaxID=2961894 RepID=A0AA42BQM9_9BACI|nr:cold-shock protein [Ectobacillus ponti]MCP8969566.1 cold-shock protein [Ectobacillus ponti]